MTTKNYNEKTLSDFAEIFTARGKGVACAIAGDENGEAIIISHPGIDQKLLLKLLRDATKRIEKKIDVQNAILN